MNKFGYVKNIDENTSIYISTQRDYDMYQKILEDYKEAWIKLNDST